MKLPLVALAFAASLRRSSGWGAHTCRKPVARGGRTVEAREESWRKKRCSSVAPASAAKFLVLSSARSGSSYVVEMLDSHPEVCAGYELMNPEWKAPCRQLGRGASCQDAVAAVAGGAIDAVLNGSRAWTPTAGAAGADAVAGLRRAWWPRWDEYRFCSATRCCARGFKWFPRTQGAATAGGVATVAAWAASTDVRFVVLRRRDVLATVASRWRKDVAHEASKAVATGDGVRLHGHSGKAGRARALPVADLKYVRAQCRQIQSVDASQDAVLARVPPARRRDVAFEDLVGPEARRHWRGLVAFVGATELGAELSTNLVRLTNSSARKFRNEREVVAALREEGCVA